MASFGWRAIFIAFGILTLFWLLPWQVVTRGRADDAAGDGAGASKTLGKPAVPIATLIRKWPLWSMSIAHVASNYVFYFLLGWLPLFLTKSRGIPIPKMTMIATLGYAAQAVAAMGFGYLSDWRTRRGSEDRVRRLMMLGGQVLAAGAVSGLIWAQTRTELTLILCLAGIATGALSLNTYAVAQIFAGPRAAGTWVGIQNAVGNLSGIFGPILTGYIVKNAGYDVAVVVTAAVAAFGALWWIVGVPRISQVKLD